MDKAIEERDKCVLCDEETNYSRRTPTDQRLHYVEGGGQLCVRCYAKIYGACECIECQSFLVGQK